MNRKRETIMMDRHERGRKGGKIRAMKLTPAERSAIARKAVQARWAQYRRAQEQLPTETVFLGVGYTFWWQG
mgnify:FL=1